MLEREMARENVAEGDGVRFHNLGFQSRSKTNVWLELHVPKYQFRFIVNSHTVVERIH